MHKAIKYICSASLSAILFILWLNIQPNAETTLEPLSSDKNSGGINLSFQNILHLFVIFSPILAFRLYDRSQLLTKYIVKEFCVPLIFCIFGFILIWLIIDLSDNGTDLANSGANTIGYIKYYLVQTPMMLVTIIPISILLSTIYSVGKMSKSNELISIQCAGKSYLNMLSPVLVICAYLSLLSLSLNYQWAPESEAQKETILSSFENGEEYAKNKKYKINSRLFKNKASFRTWFIGSLPSNLQSGTLREIEIYQTNQDGDLVTSYYAETAKWSKETKQWTLTSGMIIDFGKKSENITQRSFKSFQVNDWNETPRKIYADSLIPEELGISNLLFHLNNTPEKSHKSMAPFKTHLHYRWALPFSCFAIAMIACPIGITNSRSNIKGSGSIGLLIYFLMMLFNNLFLALGQGMKIPPFLGAWSTNIILFALGIILFLRKDSQNKTTPLIGIKILKSILKRYPNKPQHQTKV